MKILREVLSPLIAVTAAFLVGGIIVFLIGDSPITTFSLLVGNSFGSWQGMGFTLFLATPLIFTGLAVAVAFRCGLLNIGAEGQLYVSAFVTAWVGMTLGGTVVKVFGNDVVYGSPEYSLPSVILVPLCVITAFVVGAIWGGIPGFLKAKFGSHEVINTIMMNFIGIALVSYMTQYHYKIAGDPILQTAPIGEAAHIPQLNQFFTFIPKDVPLNFSFLIAVVMCLAVYIFLWKTRWGYELRAVGENSTAAEYGGISPAKQIIIAMSISGGLAGMVAVGEVLGYRHNYYDGFSAEYGFYGIAVALLGRNHPFGVLVSAIFFAVLLRGEIFVDAFTRFVSKDIGLVLQAIIILFVACLQKYSKE